MKKKTALFLLCLGVFVSVFAGKSRSPKVVVIGFDGADPTLVRKYMAEGNLPNLKKLAEEGTFSNLSVTNPPQTPVSWGTFATGWNPGRDEVFDFLSRKPGTYKPRFCLMQEVSKPFLLGRWNRWLFPFLVLVLTLGLVVILRIVRQGAPRWMHLSVLVIGILCAAGLFIFITKELPTRIPTPLNHLKGTPFWKRAADKGDRCLVFRVPDTFPANPFPMGRLLSGLGVPDMRGRVGTPYIFTTDPRLNAGYNEFSIEITPVPANVKRPVTVQIKGPFNKPFYQYVIADVGDTSTDPTVRAEMKRRYREKLKKEGVKPTIDVPLKLDWDSKVGTCTFEVQGHKETLKKGQWSQWTVLRFNFNRILHLDGMVRFYLLSTRPALKLYMSPIHFHPDDEGIPISYPRDYAEKLLKRFGYYKTMGWAIDTWTISSGLCNEDQFLSDLNNTVDAYERMMKGLLSDENTDLYVQVYNFTDRIAHILWRYMDPKHPMYVAAKAPKYQEAMRQAYERMDRIVGEAMERIGPKTTLIVLSDHGFASFRKGINYNRWLIDNGYMTLKADTGVLTLRDLFDDNSLLFKNVDWSRTKAYALGLGSLYINLKGREKHGIVNPGPEYDALCKELKERIPQMVDPDTGEHPVKAVYTRDEMYSNYNASLVPDLRICNIAGYRVSWQTSLGGAPSKLIQLNKKAWSGDHCSMDPSVVPGIFFSNRKIERAPRMIDVSPTILSCLGLKVPADLEGKPFIDGPKR